jgi:hypothetical protein
MRKITIEDCRRHRPGPDSPANWQESFYLGWVDLKSRVCGAHHISLAPGGQKDTHVWSWTMLEGKVVGRSQEHGMALPTGDYDDLTIGALRVKINENTRDLDLHAQFEDASASLAFRGHVDPVEMSIDFSDLVLGERHYENMGFVTGEVKLGGRTIPVEASAWTDHSWGPRDFSTNVSHRWMWASFGSDLSISVFGFVTGTGIYFSGWVLDNGKVYPVLHAAFHAVVADDGATPEGCDAIVRTEGNRVYRVHGESKEAALMGGLGWFAMNGLTRFECGGRMGEGSLEFNALKKLTPAMMAELKL